MQLNMLLISVVAVFVSGVALPPPEEESCVSDDHGNGQMPSKNKSCVTDRKLLQRRTKKGYSGGSPAKVVRPAGYWRGIYRPQGRVSVTALNWQMTAYHDRGSCGNMGDDYHATWCGWNFQGNCAKGKELTVPEAQKYCPGGKLKVTQLYGGGWGKEKWLKNQWDQNCGYIWLAWFTCQTGGMPVRLDVGSSEKKTKCVTPQDGKTYICNENAANKGIRVNADNYDDKFKVKSGSNNEICVERQENSGWGMDLVIACNEKWW